ncbi:MAG: hypothetical protein KZQ95_00645 [Candidatus Thiodiazotropha sp. (ex Epidulcina cf. delphinae)]|nr:hypothetical protein [Candidatus Thiodiazotropha sp. (ex Epidulcina cf. delphinae)]
MGFWEDLGQAAGAVVTTAADTGGAVIESVANTAADLVEAVADTTATLVEEGSDLSARVVEGGASVIGAGLDALFGEGRGDGVRRGGRALAGGIRRVGRVVGVAIRAGGRRVASWIRQGGRWLAWGIRRLIGPSRLLTTHHQWSPDSPIAGIPRHQADCFNISDVSSQDGYSDSGVYYQVMIDDQGGVRLRSPAEDEAWRLLTPSRETYDGDLSGPIAISYQTHRGRADAEPKHEADFDIAPAPVFEMIAAGESRLFAKESGTDNFYIAAIVRDFLDYRKHASEKACDVPGFYTKLDPEYAVPGARFDDLLLIDKHRYNRHISLANFLLYNIGRRLDPLFPPNRSLPSLLGVPGRVLLRAMKEVRPDMMLVRFEPAIWHRLDCRPPKQSGELPEWLDDESGYRYVDYGWDWGWAGKVLDRSERSIRFHKVLGMGVGRLHRHTHYTDCQGGELHVLAFNMGPIGDFASFFDGTCNYYILCRIKEGPLDENQQASLRDAYGLLWIDEQTYYSERWRLVHPGDNRWGDASRSMVTFAGLPPEKASDPGYEPYRDEKRYPADCQLELKRFWCPFRNGFIHSGSRLAVARQTCLVAGRVPVDFQIPAQDPGYDFEPGEDLLFTLVFSWGSIDRTWRWRKLPPGCVAVALSEADEKALLDGALSTADLVSEAGDVCYPQLIGLRDDMTITLRGAKGFSEQRQEGYWVQKYLPADNWEVPFVDEAADAGSRRQQLSLFGTSQLPPKLGYCHDWRFVSLEAFEQVKRYSHWGCYGEVDSRSQYYEISITPDSAISAEALETALTHGSEDLRWIDFEDRLAVYYPWCNYSALEDILISGIPTEPLFKMLHQPPSFFNHALGFKIARRASWPAPGVDAAEAGGEGVFIATLWDKRDDDLATLQPLPAAGPIALLADPASTGPLAGKILSIRLGARRVIWKAPVVQRAVMAVDPNERRIRLSFVSTIRRRPRYLTHWKRIEDYMGMGLDRVSELIRERLGLNPEHPLSLLDYDRWLQAEIPSSEPDLVPFALEHDPELVDPYAGIGYPCPDTTIQRVRVQIIEEGVPRDLLDLPISLFSGSREERSGEVEFLFSWSRQYADSTAFEAIRRFLVEPGVSTHATSIVFEDLVGHVATPESMKFGIWQPSPFAAREVPG